ncbi:hypothetical protein COY05_00155 [Candidatus Peregrinibacteria bacterium CG_4_10_14_0_2_um_filter_38_24]|nr:MAG: hypothetical protein COY05_00155 [Candidatus Peregrinibacteria bacterium CG_4_10_14_0_2_um_filter_38_24]PJC39141.1 MAG: hypothetical protein CO044_01280 [Candidatus Peregrinibacteria bacterium CG_4_9_14_0_2_um_filter_38_9]
MIARIAAVDGKYVVTTGDGSDAVDSDPEAPDTVDAKVMDHASYFGQAPETPSNPTLLRFILMVLKNLKRS